MNDLMPYRHGDEGVGSTHSVCNKHNIGGKSVCCECSGKTDCSNKDTLEEIVREFVARFFVYDMEKNKPHGDHVEAEKTAAEWLRTTLTSYRNDVLEEVLAALPEDGTGIAAIPEINEYAKGWNDCRKEAFISRKRAIEEIRHLITTLKVDI